MKKIKEKFKSAKEVTREYLTGLSVDWSDFSLEHPGIAGFIEGTVIIYFALVISAGIMRFRGKELGWVDIVK